MISESVSFALALVADGHHKRENGQRPSVPLGGKVGDAARCFECGAEESYKTVIQRTVYNGAAK